MAEVEAAFAAWRRSKRVREPIPAALWRAAVRQVARHGLSYVGHALRLNVTELKRRLVAEGERDGARLGSGDFTELRAAPVPGGGCVVELEKTNGTRLKVSIPVYGGVDWGQLKSAFLEA